MRREEIIKVYEVNEIVLPATIREYMQEGYNLVGVAVNEITQASLTTQITIYQYDLEFKKKYKTEKE